MRQVSLQQSCKILFIIARLSTLLHQMFLARNDSRHLSFISFHLKPIFSKNRSDLTCLLTIITQQLHCKFCILQIVSSPELFLFFGHIQNCINISHLFQYFILFTYLLLFCILCILFRIYFPRKNIILNTSYISFLFASFPECFEPSSSSEYNNGCYKSFFLFQEPTYR